MADRKSDIVSPVQGRAIETARSTGAYSEGRMPGARKARGVFSLVTFSDSGHPALRPAGRLRRSRSSCGAVDKQEKVTRPRSGWNALLLKLTLIRLRHVHSPHPCGSPSGRLRRANRQSCRFVSRQREKETCNHSAAANASRVKFSGAPCVHTTSSSIRTPPNFRRCSTNFQFTAPRCSPVSSFASSMSMK